MSSKNLLTSIILPLLAVSLVASSLDAKPRQAAAAVQEMSLIGNDSRQYRVDMTLNDVLPVRGLIDTGATSVLLPYKAYQMLWAQGAITHADTLMPTTVTVADGRILRADRVLLTLTIGRYRLSNVEAMIGTDQSDLLIGSAVLQRFQSFGVDHTRGILRLGQPR